MARATRNLSAMGVVFGLFLSFGLVCAADLNPRTILAAQQQKSTKKKTTKAKKTTPKSPAKSETPDPSAPAATPAGEGGLKFARDIAPILVANCAGCHNAQNRSGFNQTTFEGLMKGGKAGPAIVAGKPDESLLLARVKGEEGPKMPPGQRNLSAASIEKLENWIKSGARLDPGLQATAPLASYATKPEERVNQELAKMSPNDRDKKTETVGRERLKKANAKAEPDVQKGTNFLLFSNLPKERATSVLKVLDGQFSSLKRMLTSEKPALQGPEKISLYVFKDRATYVEFVRSVESREEVDESETSRSKLTVESPYVIAIDPLAFGAEAAPAATSKKGRSKKSSGSASEEATGPERSLVGILMEAFSSGAIAQAGAPLWVSSGLGAFLASQVEPRSRYYAKLRNTAYEQCRLGWQSKATESLGGQSKPETTKAIGFALFEWISANAAPLVTANFVQGMLQGQNKLDDAIKGAFDMDRQQFLTASGEWVYARYGGRGR